MNINFYTQCNVTQGLSLTLEVDGLVARYAVHAGNGRGRRRIGTRSLALVYIFIGDFPLVRRNVWVLGEGEREGGGVGEGEG